VRVLRKSRLARAPPPYPADELEKRIAALTREEVSGSVAAGSAPVGG
jgi:hypothetical protein